MSIWDRLMGLFSKDLAMDLGTANTLIYIKGEGVVLDEPSIVVIDKQSGRPVAVGKEAKKMYGRTPESLVAVRPMKDGVIADYDVTEKMIKYFINKAYKRKRLFHPKIIIGVPSGITPVEKKAVIDSAKESGARSIYLVEEPMAAAIGSGLPVEGSTRMVVDIGGGTTEAAVLSLAAVIYKESLRVAGDEMDEAIIEYIKRKHKITVGTYEAEDIKITIGSAIPMNEKKTYTARGKNMVTGSPDSVVVSDDEIREALREPVRAIVNVVDRALSRTSPEVASEIHESGVMMTGGGSLLRGLDRLIAEETKMKIFVAEDPLRSVVKGAGKVMENFKIYRKVCIN
jgi:rod shape-determining protein MreB